MAAWQLRPTCLSGQKSQAFRKEVGNESHLQTLRQLTDPSGQLKGRSHLLQSTSSRCNLMKRQAAATVELQTPKTARAASVKRQTKETRVDVSINLDGDGVCNANSQIPFLDHMLDQLASHGLMNVMVEAEGDTWIDDHHTCEDIALALGGALSQALGDRKGINRFGDFTAPLDEALVHVVLDLSGRPHVSFDCDIPTERIGTFDTQLVEHFFSSLATTGGITLHIRKLAGRNSHHIVEATFKAFARALRIACEVDPRRRGQIASSKGVLTQK